MSEMVVSSVRKGGFVTTAKHYGDSVSNYYETGGGSVIGDSPVDWNGLIKATGSSDSYSEKTLVFCIYPLELSDDGNWYIFGAESGVILVGHWDADGGVWIGARTTSNAIKNANTQGDGLGDWAGMIPYEWNAIMISFQIISGERRVKIKSNGVEVYDDVWGTGDEENHPQSHDGYVWGGRGDGFTGDPERGMECYVSYVWCDETYLDPDVYYDDFFDANFKPKDIGADGSAVTGGQPETYAPDGDMTINLGTADNWDEVGTVPDAPISPTD